MAEPSQVAAAGGTHRFDLILMLLMIAAFGPYLDRSFGLRTDHVLIYTAAPVAMAWALPRFLRQRIDHPVTGILVLHAACITWTLAVTFLGGFEAASTNVRLASIENAVQPVFVISLVAIVIGSRPLPEIRSVLDRLLTLYIAIMCLNTLLASLSLFADLTPLMIHLTRSENATWFAARSGIRLTGVFSQPVAHGAAMTFAVLAWCYRQVAGSRGFWSSPAILVVLVFGGVLGLSKIFYFGAPILLWVVFTPVRLLRVLWAPRPLLAAAVLAILVVAAMQEWRQGSLITQAWFLSLIHISEPTRLC